MKDLLCWKEYVFPLLVSALQGTNFHQYLVKGNLHKVNLKRRMFYKALLRYSMLTLIHQFLKQYFYHNLVLMMTVQNGKRNHTAVEQEVTNKRVLLPHVTFLFFLNETLD